MISRNHIANVISDFPTILRLYCV